jgi:hypothetical protein
MGIMRGVDTHLDGLRALEDHGRFRGLETIRSGGDDLQGETVGRNDLRDAWRQPGPQQQAAYQKRAVTLQ